MSEQGKAIAAAKMITDHELDGGGPGVLHLISPVLEVAYPDSELAKLATAAEKRAHLQIAGSAVMEGRASREHILEALLWADAGSEVAVKARGMLKNYARELGFAVFSKDYEVAAQKEHDAVSKVERAIEKAEKELGGG